MEGEGSVFCEHCGRKMGADSVHCPHCGMAVDKEAAYASNQIPYQAGAVVRANHLGPAKILLILYVAFSLISLLSLPMSIAMLEDPMMADSFDILGITSDEMKEMSVVAAAITAVSLAFAAISLFYVHKRVKWKPAWAFCAAASLILLAQIPAYMLIGLSAVFMTSTSVGAVVSTVIGLIVTYLIYASKGQFQDVDALF